MQTPRIDGPREGTWKPVLGAVFCVTAGAFDLFFAMGLISSILVTGTSNLLTDADIYPLTMGTVNVLLKGMAVYLAVAGMLAVVGGLFAAQRKNWGLALAASIAAFLSFGGAVLGVPAMVFIAISRKEFS
jgi:hypothetical protein